MTMTQEEARYARKVTAGTENSIKWRACKALEKQTGRKAEFYFERFGQREVLKLVAMNLGKIQFKTAEEREEALAALGFPKERPQMSETAERLYSLIGKMSQRCFSEKYGIPLRTLEEWLAGRRTPPEYVLDLLAKVVEYEALINK